jgi:hypothetical protein
MSIPQDTSTRTPRMWQRIGALGIVYSILYVVGLLVLAGSQPSESSSAASVTQFYISHKASVTAAVFVIAAATVVFAFFLSALRRTLSRSARDGDHLTTVIGIGGAVYMSGLLLGAVILLTLVDASHHHQHGVVLTLNFLTQDDFIPVIAGLAALTLATGIAGLRTRALPRWLSWATVALGILSVAGPLGGIAFIITPVWTLAVGIVLARQSTEGTASPAAQTALGSVERISQ